MTDEKKPSAHIPPGDPRRTTGRYGPSMEKPTVETPALPGPLAAALAEIQESVREGFTLVNANIDATHVAVDGLQTRVARLEEAAAKTRTGPQKTFSGEVRRVSENDMKQDSVIAQLLTTQAATDAKVDALVISQGKQSEALVNIGTAVSGWAKEHPTLVNGAVALATAAMLWATSWLQSKGH